VPTSTSKPAIHVLFVTYHLPTDDEPGAFRPWMEARLLREAGYRVTVITSAVQYMTGKFIGSGTGWCREEIYQDIRILRVWTISDYRRSLLRRVVNYSVFAVLSAVAAFTRVREHVDCVFAATDPIFATPFVLLISFIKRARLVVDERDLFPENGIALGLIREGLATRLLCGLQQIFRRRASAMLTATPGIKRQLVEYGHQPAGIQVLLNADAFLSDRPLSPVPDRVAEQRSRYRCIVGYAGTLGKGDDLETIIHAAAELRNQHDLGFLLIGGGERLQEYTDLAHSLGDQHIVFLGALPRTTTRAILALCDICVQALPPDPYFRSTLTSKTFDYLGLGVPVVFAGEGDTAELLREVGAGIVVPPGDASAMAAAVGRVAGDAELRATMARAGSDWYASHINVENTRRIIQAAVASPGA
jgi:glycosyltransferase involved in cell wall biosynthesis